MRKAIIYQLALIFSIGALFAFAVSPEGIFLRKAEFAIITLVEINGTPPNYNMDIYTEPIDVNKDGYLDLIISSTYSNLSGAADSFTGQVNIFYGSAVGFNRITAAQANVTFNGTSPSYLGFGVALSDFNNDTNMDIALGAYTKNLSGGAADSTGQVYIFYGNANGLHSYTTDYANITLNGSYQSAFGTRLRSADINRDGYSDLIISSYLKNLSGGEGNNTGQVNIFYGSTGGISPANDTSANVTINCTSPSNCGVWILARDFNKDNYTDLAVSAHRKNLSGGANDYTGQVYIFYGSSDGLHSCTSDQANVTFNGSKTERGTYRHNGYGAFGYNFAAGDFNNDTNIDLAIGAFAKNVSGIDAAGQVYVFYGSNGSLHSAAAEQANATINGTSQGRLGAHLKAADLNRDGYDDLIIGADAKNLSGGTMDYTGQISIFYGSSDGLHSCVSDEANITLNGTSPGYFGASFATADVNYDNVTDLIAVAEGINLSGGSRDYTGKVYVFTFNFPPNQTAIPNQSWNEDSSITINLSQYFSDVNRDSLNYTWVGNSRIAISIDESTNIVTLTPNANWYGTEYIMFYANDSYNDLVASNNITLTVSNTADCGDNTCDSSESCTSCASDCGACPAVSGSSTAAAEPKAAHTFTTVTPESPATADFKNMAVSSITLTTDETATNVKVEVKEISQTNVLMPETGVYKLIDIKASNIELKEAKIKFKVKLAWLEENDIEQGEIVLMHHKNSWEKLETIYTGKDDENAYFEAKTGSLSMFAISYQKKEVEEEEPIQEEPEQEEKAETPIEPTLPVKEKSVFLPIALSAIALSALIVMAIILKKRKKRRD